MNPIFDDIFHEKILPLGDNEIRPLWTVIIPTRNCANYLSRTLQSVLKQDQGADKMEIYIVDDCSDKDNPIEVIEKYGEGRIQFIKQNTNVGKSANYGTGLKKSKGKLIHILHGDDEVLEGFYKNMESLFLDFPDSGAAFCQCNYIDENSKVFEKTGFEAHNAGILEDWISKIIVSQRIQPPSLVVKREVYEQLGGYDNRLKYMEDWEMYVRIANYFKVAYTPVILANYRVHSLSSSQTSIKKGERIKTQKLVIKIIDSYTPKACLKKIRKTRSIQQAFYLIQFIPYVIKSRDFVAYCKILINILRFTINPRTLYNTFYFTVKWRTLSKRNNG